ncbi:MAG: hypothetical protein ACI4EN_05740 [Butyrivibrio sp.]
MRNKIEFETRVKELAEYKKAVIQKKRRTFVKATAIGGGIVCAACCALVFTKLSGLVNNGSDSVKFSGTNAGYAMSDECGKTEIMPEQATESNLSDSGAMIPESGITEICFYTGSTEIGGTDSGITLDDDNRNAFIGWIMSVELNDVLMWDCNNGESIYVAEVKCGQDIYRLTVTGNRLKWENGEWQEFSREKEKEFSELVEDIIRKGDQENND